MKITPLGKRVFIAPEVEDKIGSIHLARMSRNMPKVGRVTAISKQAFEDLCGMVHPNDRVVFDKHMQTLSEDEKTTIVEAEHILAILE